MGGVSDDQVGVTRGQEVGVAKYGGCGYRTGSGCDKMIQWVW